MNKDPEEVDGWVVQKEEDEFAYKEVKSLFEDNSFQKRGKKKSQSKSGKKNTTKKKPSKSVSLRPTRYRSLKTSHDPGTNKIKMYLELTQEGFRTFNSSSNVFNTHKGDSFYNNNKDRRLYGAENYTRNKEEYESKGEDFDHEERLKYIYSPKRNVVPPKNLNNDTDSESSQVDIIDEPIYLHDDDEFMDEIASKENEELSLYVKTSFLKGINENVSIDMLFSQLGYLVGSFKNNEYIFAVMGELQNLRDLNNKMKVLKFFENLRLENKEIIEKKSNALEREVEKLSTLRYSEGSNSESETDYDNENESENEKIQNVLKESIKKEGLGDSKRTGTGTGSSEIKISGSDSTYKGSGKEFLEDEELSEPNKDVFLEFQRKLVELLNTKKDFKELPVPLVELLKMLPGSDEHLVASIVEVVNEYAKKKLSLEVEKDNLKKDIVDLVVNDGIVFDGIINTLQDSYKKDIVHLEERLNKLKKQRKDDIELLKQNRRTRLKMGNSYPNPVHSPTFSVARKGDTTALREDIQKQLDALEEERNNREATLNESMREIEEREPVNEVEDDEEEGNGEEDEEGDGESEEEDDELDNSSIRKKVVKKQVEEESEEESEEDDDLDNSSMRKKVIVEKVHEDEGEEEDDDDDDEEEEGMPERIDKFDNSDEDEEERETMRRKIPIKEKELQPIRVKELEGEEGPITTEAIKEETLGNQTPDDEIDSDDEEFIKKKIFHEKLEFEDEDEEDESDDDFSAEREDDNVGKIVDKKIIKIQEEKSIDVSPIQNRENNKENVLEVNDNDLEEEDFFANVNKSLEIIERNDRIQKECSEQLEKLKKSF